MYRHAHEMFNICTAEDIRENGYAEEYANYCEKSLNSAHCNDDHLTWIPHSSSQTVLFKQLSVFCQRRYLPIRLMPIAIDISLIDDHLDAIVSNMGQQGVAVANTLTTWQIMNAQA